MSASARPVSAALEAALAAEISRHQVVVWLDRGDHYSGFVDELSRRQDPAPFGAPIVAHRGSYLEVMLALETHASGVDPSPLLVHVPLVNRETVKETPLLEIYTSGFCFERALETLVRNAAAGRVPPAEIDLFLAGGPPTLVAADAWMASKVEVASGELEVMLRGAGATGLFDQLVRGGDLAARLAASGEDGQLEHHLAATFGLRRGWLDLPNNDPDPRARARVVADELASWALCVEYVHDLKREPKAPLLAGIRGLSRPLIEACAELARHFRASSPDEYAALALDLEARLLDEVTHGSPGELGRIDTFRFEEERLFLGALEGLQAGRWAEALQWAVERLKGKDRSFWLEHDPTRKSAWMLVRVAAELGHAIDQCKLDYARATTLGEATDLYAEHGAPIDGLHRHLEQDREARLFTRIPHFETLRAALDATREHYRRWADRAARAWTDLCERAGALPSSEYQQRRIFEDVVRPLLDDDEKTALFMVDGLRFEMARELLREIGAQTGSTIHLRPRLAELPSVTEIGMNALAPVAEGGKLRPVVDKSARRFAGFQTAAFRVHDPETRRKVIAHRAGGGACPPYELAELLTKTPAELRLGIRQAKLTIIHSTEIDAAGEKGAGLSVFPVAMAKLHRAWNLLREAGVQRFVITSDHGFLIRTLGDPMLSHGQGHDALARYAYYPQNVPTADQLAVSLRSLQYEDVEGYLMFPRGLEVYQMGDRPYVHGGNSPTERVIPVLTMVHKRPPGSAELRYAITIEASETAAGVHSIRARIDAAKGQTGLAFAEATEIDLDVGVVDGDGIDRHLLGAAEGAALLHDRLRVRVGVPFKVTFRLVGRRAGRVKVELFETAGNHSVARVTSTARFDVDVKRATGSIAMAVAEPRSAPTPTPVAASWLDAYDDPGIRKVFAHIESYASINEIEATEMLGGARQFRAFSRGFEELAQRAPFLVRIENYGGIKRYVKESDRDG